MALALRRRRYVGLGAFDQAAWDAYQASGRSGAWQGPPNGSIEDPNGGIIYFDSTGAQDRYQPPAAFAAGAPHDNIVEKNPGSTFYGWTEYEKAAFNIAYSGITGQVTDYITQNTPAGKSPTPAVIAESDRRLLAFAQSSPRVQAALKQAASTGTFRGEQQGAFEAQEAATLAANDAQLRADAQAALNGIIAAGGVFTDTLVPGQYYSDEFLRGMISTKEWIDDFISKAKGGRATNQERQAGKLPANAPVYKPPPPAPVSTPQQSSGTTNYGGGGGSSDGGQTMPVVPYTEAQPTPLMIPEGTSFAPTGGGGWSHDTPTMAPADSGGGFPWKLLGGALVVGVVGKALLGKKRRR